MKKITLASAITASLFAFSAQAELKNIYIEGALGQAELDSSGDSSSDTSMSLLGGYQVYSKGPLSLATELGYNRYYSKDSQTASATLSSASLGGKLGYEVMPKVNVFGRLAYESMILKTKNPVFGNNTSTSNEFSYGIGASYEVAKQLTLGTQYKFVKLDGGTDLSNVNVSLGYQF